MVSIDAYRKALEANVYGLWSGALSHATFMEAFTSAVQQGITKAWLEGAAECNIKKDELTLTEQIALAQFVNEQVQAIGGFANAIIAGSKANGGKLDSLLSRVGLWVNRWIEAKNKAHAMACADEKQEFILGATREHCRSCRGLNGRVYRNSVWLANNAIPPSNRFQCGGFHCGCGLFPTTKPITKGKFPTGLLTR